MKIDYNYISLECQSDILLNEEIVYMPVFQQELFLAIYINYKLMPMSFNSSTKLIGVSKYFQKSYLTWMHFYAMSKYERIIEAAMPTHINYIEVLVNGQWQRHYQVISVKSYMRKTCLIHLIWLGFFFAYSSSVQGVQCLFSHLLITDSWCKMRA